MDRSKRVVRGVLVTLKVRSVAGWRHVPRCRSGGAMPPVGGYARSARRGRKTDVDMMEGFL